MKKKINRIFYYILMLLILAISLAGCSKNDDNEILKSKVKEEISYLDSKLINMLNKTNGITLENYIVSAEEVNEEASSSQGETSYDKEQENSQESKQSSEEQTSTNSSSETGKGQNSTNNVRYTMKSNEILLQDRNTDWENVKAEIEKLYTSWATIVLDLYKLNVNNHDILNFNADLDACTQSIKNEDKVQTLNNLAKLYSYIPKYIESISNDTKMNSIYKTKSSILNAYSLIEQENFLDGQKQLVDAEQYFLPILNDINSNGNSQSKINKIYILLKETQSSVNKKDKDIFYINYKNLIQELNNIY